MKRLFWVLVVVVLIAGACKKNKDQSDSGSENTDTQRVVQSDESSESSGQTEASDSERDSADTANEESSSAVPASDSDRDRGRIPVEEEVAVEQSDDSSSGSFSDPLLAMASSTTTTTTTTTTLPPIKASLDLDMDSLLTNSETVSVSGSADVNPYYRITSLKMIDSEGKASEISYQKNVPGWVADLALAEGTNTFRIEMEVSYGKTNLSRELTIVRDSTPPELKRIDIKPLINKTYFNCDVEMDDNISRVSNCYFKINTGDTGNLSDGKLQARNLDIGDNTILLWAEDLAGNRSEIYRYNTVVNPVSGKFLMDIQPGINIFSDALGYEVGLSFRADLQGIFRKEINSKFFKNLFFGIKGTFGRAKKEDIDYNTQVIGGGLMMGYSWFPFKEFPLEIYPTVFFGGGQGNFQM